MKSLIPLLLLFFVSCNKSTPQYNPIPPTGERFQDPLGYILTRSILETSGIADSKTFEDNLWVLEDSGNPARLFLLRHEGSVTDSFYLDGAVNRDWEDIVVGKGPDDLLSYLYVGDIGDNEHKYTDYTIYRFPEPNNFADLITAYDSIKFTYPDGSHDAEAFLVDNTTKDIYVITKRDAVSKIYRLRYPQNIQNINQAEFVGDLPFSGVVSASLSFEGTEMMLKTYTNLYYYNRTANETLVVTLGETPTDTLSYQFEPQGEAVAFANNNSGFFTLSEMGMSSAAPDLLFYPRTR